MAVFMQILSETFSTATIQIIPNKSGSPNKVLPANSVFPKTKFRQNGAKKLQNARKTDNFQCSCLLTTLSST